MSKELKWCKCFMKAFYLSRFHHRKRTRMKNHHRLEKLKDKAFKKWGCFPLPKEWC